MNLYEYSQVNNWELGIEFNFKEDLAIGEQILEETSLMLESSTCLIQNFNHLKLRVESIVASFAKILNQNFDTDKFKYQKEFSDWDDTYYETIEALGFPNKNVNITVDNNGTKVVFTLYTSNDELLNLENDEIENLSKDHRIYFKNSKNTQIAIYYSIENRDNWGNLSADFKIEYMVKGIQLVINYLKEKLQI